MKKIKVVELFAGVGGFRIGLEGWQGKSALSSYKDNIDSNFEVIWSNQWEPATKIQHASIVYEGRFGKSGHSNIDIAQVEVSSIPDHDLLVGGFPCQDYSVATTLKNSKGLIGKKGVLWWSIHKILSEKKNKPKYLFLENVDRLLKSPAKQRGRDFAIILQSLNELGYAVEWRIINAAEYGMPQRRRRVFILAYHNTSEVFKKMKTKNQYSWLTDNGVLATAFPIKETNLKDFSQFELTGNIVDISTSFNLNGKLSPFENAGIMVNDIILTGKVSPDYSGPRKVLGDVLQEMPDKEFFIDKTKFSSWEYLKGSKKESRTNSDGFEYCYSEGSMVFPDALDQPSRTIITGEGGGSPSRFKHVIEIDGKYRRLTPLELERLNMFPDNHTKLDGISNGKRAFFMGNALVVGVIEKIGLTLSKFISNESTPIQSKKERVNSVICEKA
jgi:DNA (cytosine-5)-methyltransferase 1